MTKMTERPLLPELGQPAGLGDVTATLAAPLSVSARAPAMKPVVLTSDALSSAASLDEPVNPAVSLEASVQSPDTLPLQEPQPAARSRFRLSPAMLAADLGWLLLVLATYLVRQLLQERPILVERAMSGTLFQVLAWPIAMLTSLVPFSVTELSVLVGLLSAGIWLAWVLIRLVLPSAGFNPARSATRRTGAIRRRIRAILWILAAAIMLFFLLHGVNYFRLPVAKTFGLEVRPRTVEELTAITTTLAREASALRAQSLEDANGIFRLRDGVRGTLDQTADGYAVAAAAWPQLAGPYVRPKGVLVSRLWSYTGISGIYVPFLVEANVNIDQPDYLIPDTAGHEVAHSRGFAREDEAGFISFLANIHSPNPDIRYSAFANAYVRCANALYEQDPKAYVQVSRHVSDAMSRDLEENARYWQQFDGPVAEASEQVNNVFLKSNKQVDGVRSYGRMIDLVLAYAEKADGTF